MERLGIAEIIKLLSGVALFLFGMTLMGDGLKKVAGNKLEVILYRLTNTPMKGVLLGTAITAVIQSSSATSVMVVGFVNSGMMKVRQAIGIVMGAIVGTSITGWVICLSYLDGGSGVASLLSTATLTGIIAVTGILLRMFCKSQTKNRIGDILLGFAVLMTGMAAMSGAVEGLRGAQWFIDMLTSFSNPIVGILAGTIFTSVLQSASAAVGIVQALSITGAINFDAALPLIMGIAIGAAVPVLLSALGANVDGKRTALVYLVVEVAGVVICAAVFYILNAVFRFSFMSMEMNPFNIALLNTVFRVIKVGILLPFIDIIEAIVDVLIRDKRVSEEVEDATLRLEERFLSHPALALEQSRIAINAMAELSHENLLAALQLLDTYSDEGFKTVQSMETHVDKYEDRLGTYLVKFTGQELTERQAEEVSKYLHTLSDFERISDHALNIGEAAQELYVKKVRFSEQARHELDVMNAAVMEIVKITIRAFVDSDMALATHVEPLEELIDGLCDELKLHHVDRLQHGLCTLNQGFVFNDLLTNYERVSDHCSNIAVAMIELDSDSFDTHEYLSSVKELRSASFDRYYDEYRKQFAL